MLDPQQLSAVRTDSKRALMVCGPGSGKTRCIVERTAYLLEECKVSASEIVLVTFTRRAAGEMRKRLEARVGNAAHRLTIGTFHAIALNLLHRFGELIGFRAENSTVYGEFEEQFLLREVAAEMGFLKGKIWRVPKKQIEAVFQAYYSTGQEPTENDPVYRLFQVFVATCRENNSYTFGSLLTGFILLLPQIAKYLPWKHLIIDEAHDNDRLQVASHRNDREISGRLSFVVSDSDQAIYSWRGSYPEYLIENEHSFDVYKLEANYRSVPSIVEAANRVIRHNEKRIDKTMVAVRGEDSGELGSLYDMDSPALAAEIASWHEVNWASVSVLGRNHSLLKKLSSELDLRQIPHEYIGRKAAVTNSEEFRRFHAFLKLLVNEHDNFSFLLIRDIIGLSALEYANVRVYAAENGKSHFQAWYENYHGHTLYTDFFNGLSRSSLAASVLSIQAIFNGAYPYDIRHPFDIDETFRLIFSWLVNNPTGTIRQYLNWLSTYDLQDELKGEILKV